MTQFLTTLPLLAALVAAPAWAAQPDPQTGHHPAGAAEPAKPAVKPDAKPDTRGCPMMDDKTASALGAPNAKVPKGHGADSRKMMEGKDMHCRPAPADVGSGPPHGHDHPDAAPK